MTRWMALAALAVCALAGCITFKPNAVYYTLDMTPTGAPPSPVGLEIQGSTAAEAVTRKEIYIQKTPTEAEYYAEAQWVSAIDGMVADKLATEFGAADPAKPRFRVLVHVADFGQVDRAGGADALATLVVSYLDPRGGSDPVRVSTFTERTPAADNAAGAVVDALSRCVERIAARIVADAATLPPLVAAGEDAAP